MLVSAQEEATEPREPRTRRTLLDSLGVSVVDFRCHAHVEPLGDEEPNPTHGIVFVRRGVFGRKQRGETLVADANQVLFFNAGEPYRYSHPLPGGDECTILAFEEGRARELVARYAPGAAETPARPFRIGSGLATPEAARRHYEVLALVRRGAPAIAIEDAVADLADAAVAAAYPAKDPGGPGSDSSHAAARRRELVEAVKVAVNERLESLPSLAELARMFACSPFHLSRSFHRGAGVSLRAYVRRLRARRVADRVAAGASELTVLALELGYADHSHLTHAFRAEWGVPPSRFREAQRAAPPRNNLQASRRPAH